MSSLDTNDCKPCRAAAIYTCCDPIVHDVSSVFPMPGECGHSRNQGPHLGLARPHTGHRSRCSCSYCNIELLYQHIKVTKALEIVERDTMKANLFLAAAAAVLVHADIINNEVRVGSTRFAFLDQREITAPQDRSRHAS